MWGGGSRILICCRTGLPDGDNDDDDDGDDDDIGGDDVEDGGDDSGKAIWIQGHIAPACLHSPTTASSNLFSPPMDFYQADAGADFNLFFYPFIQTVTKFKFN